MYKKIDIDEFLKELYGDVERTSEPEDPVYFCLDANSWIKISKEEWAAMIMSGKFKYTKLEAKENRDV
jgi:hypothetical protein